MRPGRRLAAVQLVRLRAVSQARAAAAFGVDPVTVWRWDQALAAGGVAGLVPARRGPKRASKLTPELAARIRELDAAGATLAEIAAATGVSTFSVRNALGRVAARGLPAAAGAAEDSARPGRRGRGRGPGRGGSGAAGPGAPGWRAGAGPVGAAGRGRRPGVHPGRAVSASRAAAGAARPGGTPATFVARGRLPLRRHLRENATTTFRGPGTCPSCATSSPTCTSYAPTPSSAAGTARPGGTAVSSAHSNTTAAASKTRRSSQVRLDKITMAG